MNVREEDLVPFRVLAQGLPENRNGRPPHVSTLHRWRSKGVGGIRLRATKVGHAWYSSWRFLNDFCQRVTEAADPTMVSQCDNSTESNSAERNVDEILFGGNDNPQSGVRP